MLMSEIYVLDTETTGFKEPVVPIQLAYIKVIEDNPMKAHPNKGATFSRMFNPGRKIEYGAMAAHGITNDLLDESEPWANFKFPQLADPDYVIGHSVDYDLGNIRSCFKDPAKVIRAIDTCTLSRLVFPDCDSHKLTSLMYYVIDEKHLPKSVKAQSIYEYLSGAHEAMNDVRMAYWLMVILATKLKTATWEDLWYISEVSRTPILMPMGQHKDKPIEDMPSKDKAWLLRVDGTDPKYKPLDPYLRKALQMDFMQWADLNKTIAGIKEKMNA
jgi:exodeoxyribonuclease X